MKESQWRVRREVVVPALAIGVPIMIALTGLITWLEHPIQIWMAGGNCCVRVLLDH